MVLVILFNFTIKQYRFCVGRVPLLLGGKAALFHCGTLCAFQKHVIISYLQDYQIKNMCIQFESYLASNIRVVITTPKKIKTAKTQTSSFGESNTFV